MNPSLRIDGIVERIAPTSFGHQHGVRVLLEGDDRIFHFNTLSEAYAKGLQHSGEGLAELTQPGDHVWFELDRERGTIARQGSLRNWTLEHRLFGQIRPIAGETPALAGKPPQLPRG